MQRVSGCELHTNTHMSVRPVRRPDAERPPDDPVLPDYEDDEGEVGVVGAEHVDRLQEADDIGPLSLENSSEELTGAVVPGSPSTSGLSSSTKRRREGSADDEEPAAKRPRRSEKSDSTKRRIGKRATTTRSLLRRGRGGPKRATRFDSTMGRAGNPPRNVIGATTESTSKQDQRFSW